MNEPSYVKMLSGKEYTSQWCSFWSERRTVLRSYDNLLRGKATGYVAERRSVLTCAMKRDAHERSLNDTTNYVAEQNRACLLLIGAERSLQDR